MEFLMLDFGDVLFYPTTGHWFLTPRFYDLIEMRLINKTELDESFKKVSPILSHEAYTLEDEYYLFREFYHQLLRNVEYPFLDKKIYEELAYNYAYESDKCQIYYGVKDELKELSEKYKLILLSDNWPCGERLLKENDIYEYFTKIYLSSMWGTLKMDGDFFIYPIRKFGLNKENALFIDDKEAILDVALSKGINVMQMNRPQENIKSKHKIITNLKNL